jgi:hypothetical protein
MRISILALLFGLSCSGLLAAESNVTLTVDGQTYSNVVFGALTPYAVNIRHATGIASVPLVKLPPDLQKRFGYDPNKAAEHHAREVAQRAALAARETASIQRARQKAQQAEVLEEIGKKAIDAVGMVSRITKAGAYIDDAMSLQKRQVSTVIPDPPDYKTLGGPFMETHIVTEQINIAPQNEPIFVLGAGKGFVDGSKWHAVIYPAGLHRYETTAHSVKTIKRFALSPEVAMNAMLKDEMKE